MPPADSGKSLTPEQIETLRKWVAQGGEYKQHWAFVAPQRPDVPAVKNAGWVRNPIDAFVLARLEREGLEPSPPAEREHAACAGCRSILIGLPPTLEELAAFENGGGDAAYQQRDRAAARVRRTSASAGAGIWLDAARYADSDGFEKDKPRFVWMYRDWVINALNNDMPYDEFIIEQIAGDLLPERDAGPARRHRLSAELDDQRGRRHRSRAVPHGGDVRPHGRHRQRRCSA